MIYLNHGASFMLDDLVNWICLTLKYLRAWEICTCYSNEWEYYSLNVLNIQISTCMRNLHVLLLWVRILYTEFVKHSNIHLHEKSAHGTLMSENIINWICLTLKYRCAWEMCTWNSNEWEYYSLNFLNSQIFTCMRNQHMVL